MLCCLSWLASFTQYNAFKFHPCYTVYHQYFLSFYCWKIFSMDMPYMFIHFFYRWTFQAFFCHYSSAKQYIIQCMKSHNLFGVQIMDYWCMLYIYTCALFWGGDGGGGARRNGVFIFVLQERCLWDVWGKKTRELAESPSSSGAVMRD